MGTYMNDGVRKIDLVLVYKEETKPPGSRNKFEGKRKFFQKNLTDAGLQLEIDRIDDDRNAGAILNFIKIHLPWETMCVYAEYLRIKTPLRLTDRPLPKKPKRKTKIWQSFDENDDEESATKSVRINFPFKERHIERYAIKDKENYFTELQRIEIAYEILQKITNNPKKPKQRGVERLLEEGVYDSLYPLHDGDSKSPTSNFDSGRIVENNSSGQLTVTLHRPYSERFRLKEIWASWKNSFRTQPLTEIRNYFGAKIGFYYAFMELYTLMLVFPSAVGLATFAMGIFTTMSNADYVTLCDEISFKKSITFDGRKIRSTTTTTDSPTNLAQYWMCPICKAPNCHPWQMGAEGCFYYGWTFRVDNSWSFVLSGFTAVWATVFLKLWKRREFALSMKWDSHDADEYEPVIRPDYEARATQLRPNPITNQLELHVSLAKKCFCMTVSVAATVLLLILACAAVVLLVVCRIYMYGYIRQIPGGAGDHNVTYARWASHAMLFLVVTFLEKAYCRIARRLTNIECPKTEKSYVTSLLWKIFVFVMLNEMIPIGYTAWVKGRTTKTPLDLSSIDELCDYGCMGEITEVVAVLLLLRLVVGNAVEIGLPLLKHWWRRLRRRRIRRPGGDESELIYDRTDESESSFDVNKPPTEVQPQYAKDYQLASLEYDGVYEELMEMMVQFAFIVMFTPALPVAPLVCFLNNVAEIRVDAIKMTNASRRPLPIHASGLGVWNKFLDIINVLGVAFNAGLLAFTSDNVPFLYYKFVYRPMLGNSDKSGFVAFTLSKIATSNFDNEARKLFMERNITECWYPGFRQTSPPYEEKLLYWEIMSLRIGVYSAYCLLFLSFVWIVNTFVSNESDEVKTTIQRQRIIVKKMLETEAECKRKQSLVTMSRNSKQLNSVEKK